MTSSHSKNLGFGTRAIHAGQKPDATTGAVMTPVYYTSTYAQSSPGVHKGFEYSRTQNPTRFALEENVAALEGGDWGLAFASGSATTATILHLLSSGDHVVAVDDLYGGTYRLFERVFTRSGLEFSYVDPTLGGAALADEVRETTRLVWIETPTNPLLKLCDIAAAAEAIREKKSDIVIAVDNTFASPFFQSPLELGADLVVHSTTKYLSGHSDVVGGVVVGRRSDLRERLAFLQNAVGAVPSPMDCFLTLRGIKTLHVRMARHASNGLGVANFLAEHSDVTRVIYPGLSSHPQHALAQRQQKGFGGMVTFEVHGGLERARQVLENCRIFACAESLGGVESLIEHPAIMTHASVPEAVRRKLGIGDGLIRVSVGLEELDDLIADLSAALETS